MASLVFPEDYGTAESKDIPMVGFHAVEIAPGSDIGSLDTNNTDNWSWLPIPIEGVSTGYEQGWEEATGNMMALAAQKGITGLVTKLMGGGDVRSHPDHPEQKTTAGGETLENIGGAVKEFVAAKAGLGTGITRRLIEQSYVSYSGPGYRSHEFSFSLRPKSKSESEIIEKIILFFKKHSAPTLLGGTAAIARLYKTPHLFEIKFAPDAGLFKIGASACTSVGVKYGGEKYNTFKDSDMPVQVDLSLSFKEMVIHDSTTIGDH
jgi:hypothetical protein